MPYIVRYEHLRVVISDITFLKLKYAGKFAFITIIAALIMMMGYTTW